MNHKINYCQERKVSATNFKGCDCECEVEFDLRENFDLNNNHHLETLNVHYNGNNNLYYRLPNGENIIILTPYEKIPFSK